MDIAQIRKILLKYKPYLEKEYGVKSIGVFGSYIKGKESKNSDVDVLVDFNKSLGLLKFMKLEYYLEDLLNKDVDLVMKTALKQRIGNRILTEVEYL